MGRHGRCGKQSFKSGLILIPVGSSYRFFARPPRAIDLHPQSCASQRPARPKRKVAKGLGWGNVQKRGLGTINKEKTREIERFARIEILVRQ